MTYITLNGDYRKINTKLISGYHLLKFIAFSTNLVELLGEGLKTYANEKYDLNRSELDGVNLFTMDAIFLSISF